MPTQWEAGCILTLTFQARADEGDSTLLRVRVLWNSKGDDTAPKRYRYGTSETS